LILFLGPYTQVDIDPKKESKSGSKFLFRTPS